MLTCFLSEGREGRRERVEGSLAERKGEGRGRSKREEGTINEKAFSRWTAKSKDETIYRDYRCPLFSASSVVVVVVSTEPQARGGRGDETDVQISYCPDLLRRFLRLKILSIIPSCFSSSSSEAQLGFSFYPSSSLAFLACLSLDQADLLPPLLVLEFSEERIVDSLTPDFPHLNNLFGRVRFPKLSKIDQREKHIFGELS